MSSYIDTEHTNVQHDSVELIRFYFASETNPALFSAAHVAFTRGYNTPLPDEPTWIPVGIEDDHLRLVFGQDVTLERGVWSVYARVTGQSKIPIEQIPGYLRVL